MVRVHDMTCDIYYIVARGGDRRKAHAWTLDRRTPDRGGAHRIGVARVIYLLYSQDMISSSLLYG